MELEWRKDWSFPGGEHYTLANETEGMPGLTVHRVGNQWYASTGTLGTWPCQFTPVAGGEIEAKAVAVAMGRMHG